MKDKIVIEIGPKEIGEILYEWEGKRPSAARDREIFQKIRAHAEEQIRGEVFRIITDLVDKV